MPDNKIARRRYRRNRRIRKSIIRFSESISPPVSPPPSPPLSWRLCAANDLVQRKYALRCRSEDDWSCMTRVLFNPALDDADEP